MHTRFVGFVLRWLKATFQSDLAYRETNEPVHDKTNKMTCDPSEDRSACASAQSDQFTLCAQWMAQDSMFLHEDSEDSDQTGRMPRLF